MIFEDILAKLDTIPIENTYLYLIVRSLKPDVSARSKMMEKYLFSLRQIDIDETIRQHFHSLTHDLLSRLVERGTQLHEYDVLTDDTQTVLSYPMKNSAMAFEDVINNQLRSNVPKVYDFKELISDEQLWAYCVGFYDDQANS